MTRTMMFCVTLFIFGWSNTLTAGAHNDYEGCVGTSEQQQLETATLHFLDDTICYETALVCAIKVHTSAHVEPILAELNNRLDFGTEIDPREEKLRQFFLRNNSPGAKYAKLFVQVADANNIDWKLLPTFAFIESGGGRVHKNNNIFGWNSGRARFRTIEDAIRFVGRALTLGPYKGKTPAQTIQVYNVHARYHKLAGKVLNRINDI